MKLRQMATVLSVLGIAMYAHTAFAGTTDFVNNWTFDDAMGQSVGDTGGQNGVMMGSSTGFGWTSGKVGTALAMDGLVGQGVSLPNGILSGSQGTISVWVKMSDLSSQNIIFSAKSTLSSNVYAVLSIDAEGRLQFQYRSDATGNDKKIQGSKILNKNEWYHLVFISTGQSYKIFVNGEEVSVTGESSGRWFSDVTNHTLSYRIGLSDASPLSGSWNGMLDEFRVYNRALTTEDTKSLYAEGNVGVPALPLAIRPTIVLSASKDRIPFGSSVVINWNATKVTSCSASGSWSGDVAVSGTRTFSSLGSDSTYTLTCLGASGPVSSAARVLVDEKGTSTQATGTQTVGTLTATDITQETLSAPGASGVAFSRNLTFGSRGDDVRRLQLTLIQMRILTDGLSTAYYGQLTKSAVIQFQKKHGLPATGFFGPLTRAKIITAI